jgi:hypothetical protein
MTRRRAAVLGLAAVVVIIVVLRYLVWIDLGARCVIIRPSLVGYDNTTVKRALETLRHGSAEDYRKVWSASAPTPSSGWPGTARPSGSTACDRMSRSVAFPRAPVAQVDRAAVS